MAATPLHPYAVWPSQITQASVPANNNALALEAQTCRIISRTVTAQPASPANGDCYIIPSGKTGAQWASFAVNSIALYRNGWYEFTAFNSNLRLDISTGSWIYWTGTAWASFEVLLGSKGADIASAATTNLANATGWYVQVTGTTTTTALGTAKAGTLRWVLYTGALQLTHNATSLILPTGANITTAAGDAALWVSEGGGNWRMLMFQRKDGTPLALNLSAMEYKGAWDAATNTPALANGAGNAGDVYRVSVAGTRDLGAGSVTYDVGDQLIYNGATAAWDHYSSADDPVTSGDVTTALGYTPERQYPAIVDLGDISGAVSIDLSAGKTHRGRLVGNVVLTLTGLPPAGYLGVTVLELVQDNVGGRTVTWPASGKWPLGVAHVVTAGIDQEDHISIRARSDGSWYGYPVEDMG